MVVRIGADLTDLNRGLGNADRLVDRFGKKVATTGRSVARMGNMASSSAASLARLSGTMPGVTANTAKMVAGLGTAGVLLGETAVLSMALTKAWRLLGVASTAVAASSAPAWLAALATPAGIAIAGIVALTAAIGGLTYAWKKLNSTAKSGGIKSIEVTDLSGRTMDNEGKSASAQRLFGIQDATFALSDANVELTLAGQATAAWGGALEGVIPITSKLVDRWTTARKLIVNALKDTSRYTNEAVDNLHLMLAALEEVVPPLVAMQRAVAKGVPGVGLTPSTHLPGPKAQKLNVGDPSRWGMFKEGFRSGLAPKDAQGNQQNLGQTIGQSLGGAAGGMVGAFMTFGPMAAILPVISGALEALEPVLVTLIEPLVEIGRIIGEALAPILEMLAPVIQLIANLMTQNLAPVLRGITVAISFVMEAFGWLVRAIGRAVDALPFVSAKGVINAGQEMIDAARAARRNTAATDKATDAVNGFAAALNNVPNVLNVNLLRHLISGSGGGGGDGGSNRPPRGDGEGNPRVPLAGANITFNIYDATDPRAVANAVASVVTGNRARGGTSRLSVAFA